MQIGILMGFLKRTYAFDPYERNESKGFFHMSTHVPIGIPVLFSFHSNSLNYSCLRQRMFLTSRLPYGIGHGLLVVIITPVFLDAFLHGLGPGRIDDDLYQGSRHAVFGGQRILSTASSGVTFPDFLLRIFRKLPAAVVDGSHDALLFASVRHGSCGLSYISISGYLDFRHGESVAFANLMEIFHEHVVVDAFLPF